jgi:hypothetical protein
MRKRVSACAGVTFAEPDGRQLGPPPHHWYGCCAQCEQAVACEDASTAVPQDAREARDQADQADSNRQVDGCKDTVN